MTILKTHMVFFLGQKAERLFIALVKSYSEMISYLLLSAFYYEIVFFSVIDPETKNKLECAYCQ